MSDDDLIGIPVTTVDVTRPMAKMPAAAQANPHAMVGKKVPIRCGHVGCDEIAGWGVVLAVDLAELEGEEAVVLTICHDVHPDHAAVVW